MGPNILLESMYSEMWAHIKSPAIPPTLYKVVSSCNVSPDVWTAESHLAMGFMIYLDAVLYKSCVGSNN